MKTIGIVTHSIEGRSLCFSTDCHCAAERLGESAVPVLDSTRLLASYAVSAALDSTALPRRGWIAPR